jgi:hypothetical protein
MKKSCSQTPGNRAKIRTLKAGSVHVKVYTGTLKKRPIHTVYWRVGEKPYRRLFADLKKAENFAKAQAEQLAAGQVHAPAISITDAQTYREAQRRLGPVDVPLHVVAGEYADIMQRSATTARCARPSSSSSTTRCARI